MTFTPLFGMVTDNLRDNILYNIDFQVHITRELLIYKDIPPLKETMIAHNLFLTNDRKGFCKVYALSYFEVMNEKSDADSFL